MRASDDWVELVVRLSSASWRCGATSSATRRGQFLRVIPRVSALDVVATLRVASALELGEVRGERAGYAARLNAAAPVGICAYDLRRRTAASTSRVRLHRPSHPAAGRTDWPAGPGQPRRGGGPIQKRAGRPLSAAASTTPKRDAASSNPACACAGRRTGVSMTSTYSTHARVVLLDRVLEDGAVLIEDGVIAAVAPDVASTARELDLRGLTLVPGLIDLHCDAIEKAEPRSKVLFPLTSRWRRWIAATRRPASPRPTTRYIVRQQRMGATTRPPPRWCAACAPSARTAWSTTACIAGEVADATSVPVLRQLMDEGAVDLLSVMDYLPGQASSTLESYLQYMIGNHAMSREQAEATAHAKTRAKDGAVQRVETLLAHARGLGILTASHDDDSIHRIATMRNLGVAMSEFPITLDTARAAVSAACPPSRRAQRAAARAAGRRAGRRDPRWRELFVLGLPATIHADRRGFAAAAQTELTLLQAMALVTANWPTPVACRIAAARWPARRSAAVAQVGVGRRSATPGAPGWP